MRLELPPTANHDAWNELADKVSVGLVGQLGIVFDLIAAGEVTGHLDATAATLQPFGIMHGGAFACLAETLVSVGGLVLVDFPKQHVVGQQVSLSLVRPGPAGIRVIGRASCEHSGRTSQVWNVQMETEGPNAKTLAVARVTVAVVTA